MKKAILCLLACAALLIGTASAASEYTVSYSENQTTGYMWYYTVSDETVLAVTDGGYKAPDASDSMVGVPGSHRWVIRALKAGEASVSFTYAWAWEETLPEPNVVYTFSADASGTLTLLSVTGMPEQYMSGTVMIRLLENPTTGYGWTADAQPQGMLTLVRDAYEADAAPEGVVGSGGVHTWVYQGAAPGTVIVTFRYARPSDSNGAAASELKLTYIVNSDLSVDLMGLDGDYSMYIP
jgi:inhibitor of cysteine peptidase